MPDLSLLAVFAHPDDELFCAGLLAHSAAAGARVTLATATSGDAGRVLDPTMETVADLADLRRAELRLSCARLGIDPPRSLGFCDSGRGDRLRRDEPRALVNVDIREIARAILDLIGELRPRVVLTHEPLGGYYHPDHVVVHRAVTAAFFAAGTLGTEAPQRLLYGAMVREAFLEFAQAFRGRNVTDGLDPDLFSVSPDVVALTFDARPYASAKYGVLTAHRSQFALTPDRLADPPPGRAATVMAAFRPMLEEEAYLVGGIRGPVPRWPLRDAFDGLPGGRPPER